MSFRMPKSGMALLTTLVVGAILMILALALVGLFLSDYQLAGRQQKSVQAYWNARSGVEAFLQVGKLPADGAFRWSRSEQCRVVQLKNGDVEFIGQSGNVEHKITMVGGDPSRLSEVRP